MQLPYWMTRSQRAELADLQLVGERDRAREALARNAIPQETCARWYESQTEPQR